MFRKGKEGMLGTNQSLGKDFAEANNGCLIFRYVKRGAVACF